LLTGQGFSFSQVGREKGFFEKKRTTKRKEKTVSSLLRVGKNRNEEGRCREIKKRQMKQF